MEHTKGEWYYEEESGLILSIPDGSDNPVSIASVGDNSEPLTPKPPSEIEANAHLIAQAPRMANLLKHLIGNGWNAGVTEEAREILGEAEGGKIDAEII